jgi:uncharacterized protein
MTADPSRDRDSAGRARNARARDRLGRPLDRRTDGDHEAPDDIVLPPAIALARAQALLDDGQPFAAHEVLEAVWKHASGPDRELWRGLAQVAVGITHALRGNESGARTLLHRGADSLAPSAATTPHGVDVDGVRSWAISAAENLTLVTTPPRLAPAP